MVKDDSPPLPSQGKRPAPLLPGWPALLTIALCFIVMAVIRTIQPLEGTPHPWNDAALANILTLIFSFIALMTLLVWFCFFSGYSRLVRLITMTGAILLAVGLGVSIALGQFRLPTPVRYAGVDGTMFPRFEFGWQPAADEAVGELDTAAGPTVADLLTTTPADFPQFLGPERNCYLAWPELDRNWQANPPQELWRRPIGAGWSGFVAVNGFAVTMEQRGDDEWVTCYEIQRGQPVWGHSIAARHYNPLGGLGPRSTPTIHQGKVYALGATGVLRCLDGKDGTLLWQDDLRARYGLSAADDEWLVQWGRAASPLIVDDKVVVPAGGPGGQARSLIAFHKDTGEVVWEAGNDQISYSSPAVATIAGVRQILIVNETTVTAHDPDSGEQLWSHPWPSSSRQDASSSQAAVVPGDRVLLSKGYGGGGELLQLTAISGGGIGKEPVWKNPSVLATKFTNVAVIGEHLYGLSNGYLECVEIDTGRKTWRKSRQANYGHGQILGVGQLILVQAEHGDVALVEADPERFLELGRIPALSGKTWNNLCLYGKRLLVRNDREAACYELP